MTVTEFIPKKKIDCIFYEKRQALLKRCLKCPNLFKVSPCRPVVVLQPKLLSCKVSKNCNWLKRRSFHIYSQSLSQI